MKFLCLILISEKSLYIKTIAMEIWKGEEFILQQNKVKKFVYCEPKTYFFFLPEISNNKTGNKMRLVSVAENKVTDVSQPSD